MEKLINFLNKNEIEYIENFDISTVSSIRLGCRQKLVVFPKSVKELGKILTQLYQTKTRFVVAGNLSNVLFAERLDIPIIITNKMQDEFELSGNIVTVSAGTTISKLFDFLKRNRLSGIEGLAGIPATIGGALKNNAGAFGYQISDRLISVLVFYGGRIFELKKSEIKFAYHYSNLEGFVILKATFLFENKKEYDIINLFNEFTYQRSESQPGGFSLGSVYRKVNGKSAGFYIERSGLKGTRVGGLTVSKKHSNFFVNDKCGSVSDFLRLSALVETTVLKQFGVTLIPEIEKLESKNETFSRFAHTF